MSTSEKIGLREAMSIGIGGMVGGGIFAILGLAAELAKGGTPLSFLIAGLVALVTSYSYDHLSLGGVPSFRRFWACTLYPKVRIYISSTPSTGKAHFISWSLG